MSSHLPIPDADSDADGASAGKAAPEPRASTDSEAREPDEATTDTSRGAADDDPTPTGDDPERPLVDPGEPTLTYYADVKPIVDAKCGQCHFSGGIGPIPLTSYDEVKMFAGLVREAVESRVMPPWIATGDLHVFEGDRRLSDEQIDTIVRWVDQGTMEGDPADEGESLVEIPRALERVDLTLEIPEDYTPEISPDDYRCFVIEWPYEETKYVTGTSFEPGTLDIVHHAIVYHVQPENAQSARNRDAGQEGPGYTCFGGSGGSAAWLMSWEPGGYGQKLPGDLGYEVRPGSVMILQIHYNTLAGLDSDRSRVELMLEDQVDRVGNVALFMQPQWPAGFMSIPANEPDAVHIYQGHPSSLGGETVQIYWVDLHMHALGDWGRIGIWRENGEYESLLEIPEWDFAWQETYIFKEPRTLYPGDQLHLECHFDNTAENQIVVNGEQLLPRDVNWGDGTTDEMCLGNVLVAPL